MTIYQGTSQQGQLLHFGLHSLMSFLGSISHAMTDGADEELSFSEIQERLHVPEEDVTRLTHSLSCAKYKILNKSPASKTVGKTDVFSMNKKFTDRMRRIRVRLRVHMLFVLPVSFCVDRMRMLKSPQACKASAAILLLRCCNATHAVARLNSQQDCQASAGEAICSIHVQLDCKAQSLLRHKSSHCFLQALVLMLTAQSSVCYCSLWCPQSGIQPVICTHVRKGFVVF